MSLLNQYNVPLSKAERALFSGLNTSGSTRSDAYYDQQVKRLADTRQALQRMPDKKTSDRQSTAEKIKMLKDRLKMLKQMIPFMSAAAAKSLKAELKQIAAQISSLKEAGAGSASPFGGTATTTTSPDNSTATATDSTAQTEAAATETTPEAIPESSDPAQQTETGEESNEAKDKATGATGTSYLEQANQSKAESAANRAEQEELEKLHQLYQSVKNILERKLQKPHDPATQAALQLQAYQDAAETMQSTAVSIRG